MELADSGKYMTKLTVDITPFDIVRDTYLRAYDGCWRAKTCFDCPEDDCKLPDDKVLRVGNSEAARLMLITNANREKMLNSHPLPQNI